MKIRWVTWWPVRYWTERFNELAKRIDVDIEAIFLAGRSEYLECTIDHNNWNFRYRFLSNTPDRTGYYNAKWRLGNPFNLLGPRVDVLIMTYADPVCIAAALLCNLLRRQYVIFAPNTTIDIRDYRYYKEILKRIVLRGAKRVFVTGPRQRDYIKKYIKNHEKIAVIGNPAPQIVSSEELLRNHRNTLRTKLGWKSYIVIIYVGRLAEEKGLFTLLDAAEQLLQKHHKIKVVLIGSGPMSINLKKYGEKRNLELEMPGFLEGKPLAERYTAADIFVLGSISEPWGLVVNEAMDYRLPIVLSRNVGSLPVLLKENVNGYSFEAGNAKDLASKLARLCENPKLRREMGNESKEIVAQHSIEAWGDAVIAAL